MSKYGLKNPQPLSFWYYGASGIGWEFTANETIVLKGLRVLLATNNTSAELTLWDSQYNKLKTVTTTAPYYYEWHEVLFDTPITLASGENYIVTAWVDSNSGYWSTIDASSNIKFNNKITYVQERYYWNHDDTPTGMFQDGMEGYVDIIMQGEGERNEYGFDAFPLTYYYNGPYVLGWQFKVAGKENIEIEGLRVALPSNRNVDLVLWQSTSNFVKLATVSVEATSQEWVEGYFNEPVTLLANNWYTISCYCDDYFDIFTNQIPVEFDERISYESGMWASNAEDAPSMYDGDNEVEPLIDIIIKDSGYKYALGNTQLMDYRSNGPYNMGWEFTAKENLELAGLRIGTPGTGEKEIVLWDSNFNKLASVTVNATHDWKWTDGLFETPVTLTAGSNYIISSYTRFYYWNQNVHSGIKFDDRIAYLRNRYSNTQEDPPTNTNGFTLAPYADIIIKRNENEYDYGIKYAPLWCAGDGERVMGWEFVPKVNITVSGASLASHMEGTSELAIWNLSYQKLVSVNVAAHPSQWATGYWNNPITLTAGTHYIITATVDHYYSIFDAARDIPFDERITYVKGRIGPTKTSQPNQYTNDVLYGVVDFMITDGNYKKDGEANVTIPDYLVGGNDALHWVEVTPTNTSALVYTKVNNGAWQRVHSGDAIPNLVAKGQTCNLSVRVHLSTTDSGVTPKVSDLKITSQDDRRTLILRPTIPNFSSAVGNMAVVYDGLGGLEGAGGPVKSFNETFTPTGLTWKGHQNDEEHVELSTTANVTFTKITYIEGKAGDEHIEISNTSATITLTNIHDL